MAVLSISECSLLKSSNSKSDRDGKPTAQRMFIVKFDAKPTNIDQVINATGLPVEGDPFNGSSSSDSRTLKSKTPACLGSVLEYVVTCDYDVSDSSLPGSPLSRPDVVGLDGTSKEQPYFMDFSDTPIPVVNSNMVEPFDKLPTNTVGELAMTITGNRATISPSAWASYLYPACAVNSNAFTVRGISIGAGEAKIKGIRANLKTENSITYYEVTWNLALAPTWDQDIDDAGFFQLNDDGSGVIPIYGADGVTPVSKPYPLDGTGYAIDDPTQVAGNQGELTFKPQPKMSFSFGWTVAA